MEQIYKLPKNVIGSTDEEDEEGPFSNTKSHNNKPEDSTNVASDTLTLSKFGRDITLVASQGKLDPVIGREREIERMAQILCRRKKNNPILIGEPGVGKSAIVEGLAMRINERRVSRMLFDKKIFMLDLSLMVAGTKYRGQFEERVKKLLAEVSGNKNIILFIDEIHTMVGAGGSSDSLDVANMLKPALARGEVQCIGATTINEYRKNIEKDGALERRFQKVLVEPTTVSETEQILRNIKERYEDHHNVTYTDEAIRACVTLTDRYITARQFPDKAVAALDEAGSNTHVGNVTIPDEITKLEHEIATIKEVKINAVRGQNFELAASFRDQEKRLQETLDKAKEEWISRAGESRTVITEEHVARVVAMMTGIPVQRIAQAETARLLSLRQTLKSKIVGQDEAIDKLVRAIQRNRVGLKNPGRPIGSFIFVGPTGVGKTHLANLLASELFDSKNSIIRVDMSEYMEKYTVSRMIGAAPGYVGFEEGGQLTEKVRHHPYSVVLFDEIEKAHPDVFNILLQVLDEGHLTDSLGRKVDFKNTIIIMTSNIGSREVQSFGAGLGFAQRTEEKDADRANAIVMKELRKKFAPEFLNRVDDIIAFRELSAEAISQIVDIEISSLVSRVASLGYVMRLTDRAKRFIADKSYDAKYGARPLRRSIQRYVEDSLAERLLDSKLVDSQDITVDYLEGEELIFC